MGPLRHRPILVDGRHAWALAAIRGEAVECRNTFAGPPTHHARGSERPHIRENPTISRDSLYSESYRGLRLCRRRARPVLTQKSSGSAAVSGRLTFARIQRFHEILFILSLIVVFVSAAGAHGLF